MPDQVLGIRSASVDEPDDLMDMFRDDDSDTEPGGAVEVAPAQTDPEPVEDERVDLQEGEQVAAAETPAEPAETPAEPEHLWAGKYQDPKELERSYGEVTTAFTNVTQQNAQMRKALEDQQNQLAATEEQMAQIVQFLQAKAAEDDPDFAEELARRQQLEQMVNARTKPLADQLATQQQVSQQQQQAQAYTAEARGAIQGFFNTHPEIEPGSPQDMAITETVQQLMQAGVPIDVRSVDHIEVALEASRNPAFAVELMMTPQAVQVPGGVARIRERSGATMQRSQGPGGENPTRPAAPVRRPATFVETGSGGAPQDGAPGDLPTDEFDQAVSYYRENFKKGPLFGSKK